MKNTLIRTLAFLTLATSLSAFAATGEPKRHDSGASASQQQSGCPATGEDKKQQKSEDKDQQEKDFDRLLMGIYG
jgi:hypothetical protein